MHHAGKLSAIFLTMLLLLTACTAFRTQQQPVKSLPRGQTLSQLHLEQNTEPKRICAWLPYFSVAALFDSPDETVCRKRVSRCLEAASALGIDTLFVHVCAFGESFYPSLYYPTASEANGHDVMEILTLECARCGIALHAWINPLRLQTEKLMTEHTGDARLCAWFRSEQTRAENLTLWDGRYYFSPSSAAVWDFLAGAVTELMTRYRPAGVHIDDYFYPTQDAAFDAEVFRRSGQPDLAAWRTERISAMVRRMYRAVHEASQTAVFSISPQGNLPLNRKKLYADVETWCAEEGYCDLMLPQLYFGYQNELCPFTETAAAWGSLPRAASVRMIPGLAAYKYGEPDRYAGSGEGEWQDDPNLLLRECMQVLANPEFAGLSLYHLDSVLALPETAQSALLAAVR
ncbi:MAG: family 10 glycosylhydrolase [Oscillospiraceae bacterium]|nr:family 10 glycosylhydrolase [Oscillospiraceae bacterium]